MLSPNELRARSFTRAMRGYNTAEVDEYIDFVLDKYEELFRENDELNRKLNAAVAKLDEIKEAEDDIRTTLTRAQAASRTIIKEANQRSDLLLRSVKGQCDSIIADMQERVAEEKQVLVELNRQVSAFKTTLYNHYNTHIENIERISGESYRRAQINIDQLTDKLITAVKRDIASAANTSARISDNANNAAEAASNETYKKVNDAMSDDTDTYKNDVPADNTMSADNGDTYQNENIGNNVAENIDIAQNLQSEPQPNIESEIPNLNENTDIYDDFDDPDVTKEFTVPLSSLRRKNKSDDSENESVSDENNDAQNTDMTNSDSGENSDKVN